ncbi:uncharacterized protein LOC126746394 [Anthonomus grandis grandis]|uniref:uncharacterized protein LOC126746394 n=1 Tax=Anthonomus grandis grandis TaxID=2921223 RepID=UPI002165FC51|nr:uncharacterized protein LOC126746394 [Anthonomus grandis grandis]
MGELPSNRVTPSRIFSSVFVDYAGPFEIKASKTKTNKIIKAYICIFVCSAVKAVHIEVISDLTSNGFLSVLKRFVSRRGICDNIYSDNATNFVGANNELVAIRKLVESSSFKDYLGFFKITWHFLPPRSPHFGGLHEAAVKSCKHHIKRVLGGIHLDYEEFYIFAIQIEAILNSRPLTPISSDPCDLEALTPGHFLIGQQLTAIPERDLKADKHFWARWSKEYLHLLQVRTKWNVEDANPNIHVGSMVILKEENVPSTCWPLGRVVITHPGKDGIIRVVTVRTKSGTLKRAVNKLALLPIESEVRPVETDE